MTDFRRPDGGFDDLAFHSALATLRPGPRGTTCGTCVHSRKVGRPVHDPPLPDRLCSLLGNHFVADAYLSCQDHAAEGSGEHVVFLLSRIGSQSAI